MNTVTLVLPGVAILVAILVALVLVLAARRPGTFALHRSTRIQASPEKILPLIADLRAHESWSPFDRPDPATRKVHSGAAQGKGAVYEWDGRGQAGSGRIEISESSPSRVVMRLDMHKPIQAANTVTFTLTPRHDATEVTWAMEGDVPYLARIAQLFFSMDRVVGNQFDTGLANLKAIVERY